MDKEAIMSKLWLIATVCAAVYAAIGLVFSSVFTYSWAKHIDAKLPKSSYVYSALSTGTIWLWICLLWVMMGFGAAFMEKRKK